MARNNPVTRTIELARRTGNYRDAEAQADVLAMNAPSIPPAPEAPPTTPEATTTEPTTQARMEVTDVDQTIPLRGQEIVNQTLSNEQIMVQCLFWIGFQSSSQRMYIMDESISNFEDIRVMLPSVIDEMSRDWQSRTERKSQD